MLYKTVPYNHDNESTAPCNVQYFNLVFMNIFKLTSAQWLQVKK